MIPPHILTELFDIKYRPSDMSVEAIVEALTDLGYTTTSCNDCDLVLYLDIIGDDAEGELRIDRLQRCFQLNIKSKSNSFVVLPIIGDWHTISDHLELLNALYSQADR